jgi:Lrp/AsnC family leucine-responsive transcriptional regulator
MSTASISPIAATPPDQRARAGRRSTADVLDDADRRLLQQLVKDPRLSKSALARRVGLSTPTVCTRVARLERLGVIHGYRVDVDPQALGWNLSAWLRVRPGPGQVSKISELARQSPQVSECHRVTGEDSFLIRVHAGSMEEFEQILDRFLLHGATTTAMVQSSPVPPRPLPIDPNDSRPPEPVPRGRNSETRRQSAGW